MTANTDALSGPTRAIADFAFGGRTGVVDVSRPLAWLSPEEMQVDLADPVARRFGDYELIEKIGQGGMGVVYRARQHGLERDVAVKLLSAGPWASEEFVARFRREARSAARMQHPNIVEIYEFGHRDGLNFFSMRLIEGETLAQKLAREGPLPARQAAALLRTLAEAMDYAHRLGVLHLDLKPANVLLTPEGVPLIADFGLARRIDAGHDGGTEISGTPSYMAPEQATLESHPLSASTDIYGLGAVLYECLTGRAPFLGADAHAVLERVASEAPVAPHELRRDVPLDLEAICLKCLEKDPAQRYASARAMGDDLGRFLEGRGVSVRTPGRIERLRRWARRDPKMARYVALDVLAGLIAVVFFSYQLKQVLDARKEAQVQRAAAVASLQAAQTSSEIGAFLYSRGGDAQDDEDQARALIEWLRARWPGDEGRQADALSAFAASVGNEKRDAADQLLATITAVIGADYRQAVIEALQRGTDPQRHLYSAMLAWNGRDRPGGAAQFDTYLRSAMAGREDDVFAWQVAATYCPEVYGQKRCLYPRAAETLVRIAPDNMHHWLLLLTATSDPARRRELLREAAKRTVVDDQLGENYSAYARAFEVAAVPLPPLLARPVAALAPSARPEVSIALAEARSMPYGFFRPLIRDCLPPDLASLPADVRADCVAVGARMARSDDALIARMIGVAIARPLAMGTPLAEEMKQVRVLYTYLDSVDEKLGPRQRMSYPAARLMDDIASSGEMIAMQRRAEYFGLPSSPPADWQPDDPRALMTARERLDHSDAVLRDSERLLAQGDAAGAVALLAGAEHQFVPYGRDGWQFERYLLALGKARTGLGEFATAEGHLLEAWGIAQSFSPASPDRRECLSALVAFYAAWDTAEPGQGSDGRRNEWQRTLDQFEVAAAKSAASARQ
jgi:hypothetical protein